MGIAPLVGDLLGLERGRHLDRVLDLRGALLLGGLECLVLSWSVLELFGAAWDV